MRTITISPGEEIRIVCEGEAESMKNNNSKNKNNKNKNNNNSNNNSVEEVEVSEVKESNNNDDFDFEEANSVSGGKRKTRKSSKKSARKTTQKGGKKRKANGYMKFASEMRPQILKENPELRSNVVSVARKIGEAWRKLPESERKKY